MKKLLIYCLGAYLCVSCIRRENQDYTLLSGDVFHTLYNIQYGSTKDYSKQIDSTFKRFSASLNPFDSTSLISAINRNASMQTDSMLRYVWSAARDISDKSQGSYDVTCSPFINAWGFGFDSVNRPPLEVIDSLKEFVGYKRVELRGTDMYKEDPRTIFDFSSISKGYCSDLIGAVLSKEGVDNYLVELGGEIAFRGKNPEGKHWRVGINKPIEDETNTISELEMIVVLDREQGGIATSGNYRNFKLINGRKVGHTINPQTGLPIQTDVLSATILAPNCMIADGLATACMTMSSDRVPHFISQFPNVEYLLILADNEKGGFRVEMSEGMRKITQMPSN